MMARQMIGGQERQSWRTPWRTAGLCGERILRQAQDERMFFSREGAARCCCVSEALYSQND